MLKKIGLTVSFLLLAAIIGCSYTSVKENAPALKVATTVMPQDIAEDIVDIDLQELINFSYHYKEGSPGKEKFEALIGKTLRFKGKVFLAERVMVPYLYLEPDRRQTSNAFRFNGFVQVYVDPSSPRDLTEKARTLSEGDVITVEGVLDQGGHLIGMDCPNTFCGVTLTKLN